MPDIAMPIPPWLTRDYSPVETFLRAYQTGAQISEAQTRLAEQQRQANMDSMARREALQANMARAAADLAVQSQYEQQRIALQNAQLEETKSRNTDLAQEAMARIQETAAHNAMLEQLRGREVGAREREAATREAAVQAGKFHFGPQGQVLKAMPDGTVQVVREGDVTGKLSAEKKIEDDAIKQKMAAVQSSTLIDNETKANQMAALIQERKDLLREWEPTSPGSDVLMPKLPNLVPPVEPGPRTTTAPYPEGTILRKKDGSHWIVRNGEAVPYGD